MVTGIIGSSSNQIQQLMAEMMKKMKSADTDGTSGLSKNELSSINTDNDPGGARFLKELSKNFDKIDSNSDGQLSKSEIDAAKPAKNSQMGPPPPPSMSSENTDSNSSSSSNSSQISSLLDLFTKQSLNSYSNNSDLNSSILSSLDVAV